MAKGPEYGLGSRENDPSGLRNFAEKLKSRLNERFIKSALPETTISSDALVLGLIGGTWGYIRESDGYSIEDAVRRINTYAGFGIDADDLILFEGGWIDPADYKEGLIEAMGKGYGHQGLAEIQMDFFNHARNRPKTEPNP